MTTRPNLDAMAASTTCPVCSITVGSVEDLASHLVEEAEASDGRHVMWLNRHATKYRMSPSELAPVLAAALAGEGPSADRVPR
jgi:hypothetical protein